MRTQIINEQRECIAFLAVQGELQNIKPLPGDRGATGMFNLSPTSYCVADYQDAPGKHRGKWLLVILEDATLNEALQYYREFVQHVGGDIESARLTVNEMPNLVNN